MLILQAKKDILSATRKQRRFLFLKTKIAQLLHFKYSYSSLKALLGFCLINKDALFPSQSKTNSALRLFSFAPAVFLVNSILRGCNA
jgi:hypothetical protein